MALREVTLRWDVVDPLAGSLFELWLRKVGNPWAIVATGAVDTVNPTQSFGVGGLEAGEDYEAQIRQSAGGRYRTGYEGSNPSTWPADSLIEFTTASP